MLDPTSLPVGLIDGASFDSSRCDLQPGALLALFSDGITEAARDEEFFGEERLIAGLRARASLTADEIVSGVLEDVWAFVGEGPARDDITLLLVRRS